MNTTKTIEERLAKLEEKVKKLEERANGYKMSDGIDPLFDQAVSIISQFEKVSASLLQRRLMIGYARAARLLDQLEEQGYVGPSDGSQPREVLKRS